MRLERNSLRKPKEKCIFLKIVDYVIILLERLKLLIESVVEIVDYASF
jgi:hypothetical protein